MAKIDQLRTEYREFASASPTVDFDTIDVPEKLWPLIPYASFWGLADDLEREQLVDSAPPRLKESLQRLIAANDDALDEWLAGPQATDPKPSGAYIAFSAMRMAADYM
jgi:hypothetical protein